MTGILAEAEAAFRAADLEKLHEISFYPGCDYLPVKEFSRINQLLGDLYRRNKNFRGAKAAYLKSHNPPENTNVAALYGLAECCVASRNVEEFKVVLAEYFSYSKMDFNLISRLMIAAARLNLPEEVDQLATIVKGSEPDDARYWYYRARAERFLGRQDRVNTYCEKATQLALDNKDLLVEIALLNYNVNEYWELRYNSSQGERAVVPVSSQGDQAYIERRERDIEYLRNRFAKLFGDIRFEKAAECGCGTGRLTAFLREWCDNLDCFDISPTAIEFAKENTQNHTNVLFSIVNLVDQSLPSEKYDLVFDFTVVQHVADKEEWSKTLANYAQACKAGGFLFLVEVKGNDTASEVLHVQNASPESYQREVIQHGFKIIFEETTPWNEACLVFQRDG